jgi:hypothetical protein
MALVKSVRLMCAQLEDAIWTTSITFSDDIACVVDMAINRECHVTLGGTHPSQVLLLWGLLMLMWTNTGLSCGALC